MLTKEEKQWCDKYDKYMHEFFMQTECMPDTMERANWECYHENLDEVYDFQVVAQRMAFRNYLLNIEEDEPRPEVEIGEEMEDGTFYSEDGDEEEE